MKNTIVNVLGELEDDPICNFRDCYHPYSVHGKRSHMKHKNCVCKHFRNSAIGIQTLNQALDKLQNYADSMEKELVSKK